MNMFDIQDLHKLYWTEAMTSVVEKQKRCPTKTLDFITRKKVWSGENALHCTYAYIRMLCLHNGVG